MIDVIYLDQLSMRDHTQMLNLHQINMDDAGKNAAASNYVLQFVPDSSANKP